MQIKGGIPKSSSTTDKNADAWRIFKFHCAMSKFKKMWFFKELVFFNPKKSVNVLSYLLLLTSSDTSSSFHFLPFRHLSLFFYRYNIELYLHFCRFDLLLIWIFFGHCDFWSTIMLRCILQCNNFVFDCVIGRNSRLWEIF